MALKRATWVQVVDRHPFCLVALPRALVKASTPILVKNDFVVRFCPLGCSLRRCLWSACGIGQALLRKSARLPG